MLTVFRASGVNPNELSNAGRISFKRRRKPQAQVVGLSDGDRVARSLGKYLHYRNTFFDTPPQLDITSPTQKAIADVLLASDVLEHTLGEPQIAFSGCASVLRPGGILVLTVPYNPDGWTVEHFPGLMSYSFDPITQLTTGTFPDGSRVLPNAVYHGGPGSTLELRMYSRQGVIDGLSQAGFNEISVDESDDPEFGVFWNPRMGIFTAKAPEM